MIILLLKSLFSVGLLSAVVYAYLKAGRSQRRIVPSTFLLGKLRAQKTSSKKKLKLPPRFWLDLLISLLVITLLFLPEIKSTYSQQVTIYLDNSISMSAREAAFVSRTNFSGAKELLLKKISANNTYRICYLTQPDLCEQKQFRSSARINAELRSATVVNQEDQLSKLTSVAPQDLVVSDYQQSGQSLENYFSVGVPPQRNIAISQVILKSQDNFLVSLKNFGDIPASGSIKVQSFYLKDGQGVFRTLQEQTVKIEALSEENLLIRTGGLTDSAEFIRFALIDFEAANLLSYDDQFFVAARGDNLSSQEILVLSDQAQPAAAEIALATELAQFLKTAVSVKSTAQLIEMTPEELAGLAYVIAFSKQGIRNIGLNNLQIVINPGTTAAGQQSALWRKNSPLLEFLDPKDLKFPTAKPLNLQAADRYEAEISVAKDSVLLASKISKAIRSVVAAFPVLPLDKQNKALSILLLNIDQFLRIKNAVREEQGPVSKKLTFSGDRTVDSKLSDPARGLLVISDKSGELIYQAENNYIETESSLNRSFDQKQISETNEKLIDPSGSENLLLQTILLSIISLLIAGAFLFWARKS